MKRRAHIFQYWRELTIKNKFRVAFGTLIIFLTLMAVSSTVVLNVLQNKAERSNVLSTEIRDLVEGMNSNLYKARNLEKDFFLWYPIIGYTEAQQKYGQGASNHIENVEKLSLKLQNLISRSDVSDAWYEHRNCLNLYILSAKRHSFTVKEMETLIARLATNGTGLQDELTRISSLLAEAFHAVGVKDLMPLFHQMRISEKEYLITRKRPLMQSAFNVAVPLKEAIALAPTLGPEHKTELLASLNKYLTRAEELVDLDVAIRSKFKGFDLASEAINPITEELLTLANLEIKRGRAQIDNRRKLSILIIVVTGLAGLLLSSLIALILNKSITANVVKLTEATREFQAGNLEAHARIESADEFGELGDTFNEMVASINAHVDNLEQKVSERTAELSEKNKELSLVIDKRDRALEQERNLTQIIEKSLHEIYIFDVASYKFLFVNEGARVNTGYSQAEFMEMTPVDVNPQMNGSSFAEITAPLEKGQKEKVILETVQMRKDGTTYPVELHFQMTEYHALPVFVATILDISHRKMMEERLLLSEKMSSIAGLAAGVAHEINTPLAAILQASQLVQMGIDPESPQNREKAAELEIDLVSVQTYFKEQELDFFIDGIRSSALSASKTIKGLLEFSRPHEGTFSATHLNTHIQNALTLAQSDYDLGRKYDINNVTIIEEYDAELSDVMCVGMEIEQVILNLIKNSVQAMVESKNTEYCLTLRTLRAGEIARIEVEDNGPGMDNEIKKQIFNPFFTTKDIGSGTGLGLSVSYTIICEKHHGKIWVESEPGNGTKFIIEMPLTQTS